MKMKLPDVGDLIEERSFKSEIRLYYVLGKRKLSHGYEYKWKWINTGKIQINGYSSQRIRDKIRRGNWIIYFKK